MLTNGVLLTVHWGIVLTTYVIVENQQPQRLHQTVWQLGPGRDRVTLTNGVLPTVHGGIVQGTFAVAKTWPDLQVNM